MKDRFHRYEKVNYPVSVRPMDKIAGYWVRPGMFDLNGATSLEVGVNFTIHTHRGTSCELLLFHRGDQEPYAVIPFPKEYKIGDVYSMIVFNLKLDEFEYAYRIDGPWEPGKGLLFNQGKYSFGPLCQGSDGSGTLGRAEESIRLPRQGSEGQL